MIRRKLYYDILEHLPKKEFTIITGARQTGKSTLLRQVEEHCKKEGLSTVFFNLENRIYIADLDSNPLNLLRYLPGLQKRVIVFID